MEKKRKNENEEEQKMIKKGKKKRIIKDWKNPVRIQYQIWTNDGSRTVYDSSPYSFLFFGVQKKDKGAENLYNVYINSESDKERIT